MKSTINQFLSEKISVKNRAVCSMGLKKLDKNDELSSLDSNSTKTTCNITLFNKRTCVSNEVCSFPRKKSKISIQMEKLENEIKEYDEMVKKELSEEDNLSVLDNCEFEDEEENIKDTSDNLNNFGNNKYKKFIVYFYCEFDETAKYVFPIESETFNIENQYIYELIGNIVKIINNKRLIINYNSINYLISLKDCEDDDFNFYINNYELKPCKKKNNYPKDDLPNYSSTSLLKNIINEKISFISKNSLNIMFLENYEAEINNNYENQNSIVYNNDSVNIKEEEKEINISKDNSCFIF